MPAPSTARSLATRASGRSSLLIAALLALAPAAARGDDATPGPDLGEYLRARFGAAYAAEARLDAALTERARKDGVGDVSDLARLQKERLSIDAVSALNGHLEDVAHRLSTVGVPGALLEEAIDRAAWRRATAAAIIIAERAPPSDEVLRRVFESRYGPGGVVRVYRQVFFTLDPVLSRAFSTEEIATESAALSRRCQAAAGALAKRVQDGAALAEAALAAGAIVRPLDSCVELMDPAGRRSVESAPPGTPVVVMTGDAWTVALVRRRVMTGTIEAVKAAVLPRPGEAQDALLARLQALIAGLTAADDPALYAIDHSDDEADRRTGGVIRATIGPGGVAGPAAGAGTQPSSAPMTPCPPALLDALAALQPGAVTAPVPWRKGYAIARLTELKETGIAHLDGSAALFSFGETAVRQQVLAGRAAESARARAEATLARIGRGEDLGRIAAAESEDPASRSQDGRLLSTGLDPALGADFLGAIGALRPGDPAVVLRSARGYHVIRREPESVTRFEDARSGIAKALQSQQPEIGEVEALLRELGKGR